MGTHLITGKLTSVTMELFCSKESGEEAPVGSEQPTRGGGDQDRGDDTASDAWPSSPLPCPAPRPPRGEAAGHVSGSDHTPEWEAPWGPFHPPSPLLKQNSGSTTY